MTLCPFRCTYKNSPRGRKVYSCIRWGENRHATFDRFVLEPLFFRHDAVPYFVESSLPLIPY